MYKKYLILFLLVLIASFPVVAQLEVKPGSFKEVQGFVNINTDKMYDDNDKPYAVLKINTENINDKQRHELYFQGNAATFFEIEYKVGEVWVYISYYATYIKISHPDLSSTEFWFPFDLEPKKGYELTLINSTNSSSGYGTLTITSKPESGATISINGDVMTYKTPHTFDMFPSGTYNVTLSKEKYKTVTKNITINSGDKRDVDINMPLAYGYLSIKSEPSGADIYIDGNNRGKTPISLKASAEKHKIKISKAGYESISWDLDLQDNDTIVFDKELIENFNITIKTDGKYDKIYIDGNYESYSPVTRRLSIGKHIVKVERGYDKYIEQEIIVEPGGEKVFNIIVESQLNITTNRQTDIFVDNRRAGVSPQSLNLTIGEHHIKAVNKEKVTDTIINLKQGVVTNIFLDVPQSRDERLFRFDIGCYAGLGFKKINSTKSDEYISNKNWEYFAKGLYTTIKIRNFGIKAEITSLNLTGSDLYTEYSTTYPYTSTSYTDYYNFSLINIPIMIGYETDNTDGFLLSFYLGQQINICNSATYDVYLWDYSNETIISSNQSIKNYERISYNIIGEINIGRCYKKLSISFLTLKFDLTKPTIVKNNGTEKYAGDLQFSSFIWGMQLDYNF